jgi:hypothetical protein
MGWSNLILGQMSFSKDLTKYYFYLATDIFSSTPPWYTAAYSVFNIHLEIAVSVECSVGSSSRIGDTDD